MNPFSSNLFMPRPSVQSGSPSVFRPGSAASQSRPVSPGSLGGDAFEKPLQEAMYRQSSDENAPVSREGDEHQSAGKDLAVADDKPRDQLASPEGRARYAEKSSAESNAPDGMQNEAVAVENLPEAKGGNGSEGEAAGVAAEDLLLQEILAAEAGAEDLPAPGAGVDKEGNSPDSMKDVSGLKGEGVAPGQEKGGNGTGSEGVQLPAGEAGGVEKIFAAEAGEEALPALEAEADESVGSAASTKRDLSGLQGEEPVSAPEIEVEDTSGLKGTGSETSGKAVAAGEVPIGVGETDVIEEALATEAGEENVSGLKGTGPETGGKAVATGEVPIGVGETKVIEEVIATEAGEENASGLKTAGPETGGKGAVSGDAQIRAGETGVVDGPSLETKAKAEELLAAGAEEEAAGGTTDKGKDSSSLKGEATVPASKAGEGLPGPEVDGARTRGRDVADSRFQGEQQGQTATGEGAADTPDSETGWSNRDGSGSQQNSNQMMAAEGAGPKEASLPADGPGSETIFSVDQGKRAAPARAEPVAGNPGNTVSGSQAKAEVNVRHFQSPPSARGIPASLPSQVHMEIHEPDLGKMHWSLTTEDGRVMAKAMVDNIRLQELLQGHQDFLRNGLKEAGLQMDGFDVWVGSGSRDSSSSLKQSHTGANAREPETGPEPDDSKGEEARGENSSSEGLDLFA